MTPPIGAERRPLAGVGLSTYAFFWRGSTRVPEPMSLADMIRETAVHGLPLFQICDWPAIDDLDAAGLAGIRAVADDSGVRLELGTRGLDPQHLRRQLAVAEALGATVLRSMWTSGDDRPAPAEAARRVREVLPALEAAGVTLALETYEQVDSAALVDLVRDIDSPFVGICLDPANTVANLELPADVTRRCAPYVVNWHVKDFDFVRAPGWVGFSLTGTALGRGRLDYDAMRELIGPGERGISQIVEFWLPWQQDVHTTTTLEAEWTAITIDYLRSRNND